MRTGSFDLRLPLAAACTVVASGPVRTPRGPAWSGEPPPDDPCPLRHALGGARRISLPSSDKRKMPAKHIPAGALRRAPGPYVEEDTTFELHWGAAVGHADRPTSNPT